MAKIQMSREGYEKLQQELTEMITVKRQEVAQKLKEARSYGDLSENAEYDEAKNEQAILEGRIAELQAMVDNAVSALITAQAERANSIVEEFHDAVEAIANALLDQEVLDAEEVLEIAREYGVVGGRDSERSPGERPAA